MKGKTLALERVFEQILLQENIEHTSIDLVQRVQGEHPSQLARVPKENIVNDILLTRGEDLVLAIYPESHEFELAKLERALGENLNPVSDKTFDSLFPTNQTIVLPPINQSPGLQIIFDEQLSDHDCIFYRATRQGRGYIVSMDDLSPVVSDEVLGISFSRKVESESENDVSAPDITIRERMKRLHELPPMSETTSKLLALRDRYEVNADYLINIIEDDPVLAAQVVSYANSAFFGHGGSIKTLKDAIFRVLGINAVIDLALGLSIGKTLSIPHSGPLGSQRLWRHATYSAALMQKLATQMPWGERPELGTAYLAGLLHDMGFLILGFLFKKEYSSLSKLVDAHPETPIMQIEKNVMGMTHCDLGNLAMRLWNMPEEISVVARHHHNENYDGEHAVYVWLLNLVERLLAPQGLSTTGSDDISDALLEKLGLREEDVILAADEVIQSAENLDNLASQMSA